MIVSYLESVQLFIILLSFPADLRPSCVLLCGLSPSPENADSLCLQGPTPVIYQYVQGKQGLLHLRAFSIKWRFPLRIDNGDFRVIHPMFTLLLISQ